MQTHNPVDLDVLYVIYRASILNGCVSSESSGKTAPSEHLLVTFPYFRSAISIRVGEIKLIYFSVSEGHMSGKGD